MRLPPPPANFTEAKQVRWARLMQTSPAFTQKLHKPTGRRLQGVKYEKQVHEYMYKLFPAMYVASPWLYFEGLHGVRWCQPDGLIFDIEAGLITLIEVKYQHTSDAWWQLRRLYEPVLRAIFPKSLWRIQVLVVVKWFDPHVEWPEGLALCGTVGSARRYEGTSVFVYTGKI